MSKILRLSGWAGIALCSMLMGCEGGKTGETNKNLLSRYSDKVKQRREALLQLAGMLPPPGTFAAGEKCPPLSPPLAARTGHGRADRITPGNADWMMVERLAKPVVNDLSIPPQFSLLLQSALLDAIALADPESRDYCGDSRDNVEENAQIFQAASEVRYVIVLRVLEHTKPTAAAGEDADAPVQYTDGRAVFEGLICDLETPRIVCGFRAVAEPSFSKTTVRVEKGKSAALRLEKELQTNLDGEVRKQIFAVLAQVTGG